LRDRVHARYVEHGGSLGSIRRAEEVRRRDVRQTEGGDEDRGRVREAESRRRIALADASPPSRVLARRHRARDFESRATSRATSTNARSAGHTCARLAGEAILAPAHLTPASSGV